MSEDAVARRLAAILAADVVGYSRLMEANEEATLAALKSHQHEVLEPAAERSGGRVFKAMGDGFLIEFPSIVNALRCALEVQREMAGRNAYLPDDRRILFRIGLNVGDLIVDGDDFFGDGVNLASRIEGLAPPGGIACSAIVRDQVGGRLEVDFADLGEKTVKNISHPVRVFSVDIAPGNGLLAAGAAHHERPSVAVLPFANMSNDPEQEFFSDGITEDIITDLSNVSGLFVLGRNTVFAYKGKAVKLDDAARQLGVMWLLEGSVRKAGNRVRITAQLIEGATGGHVWAARYDRDLTDIFDVQDEITRAIVEQLKVKLLPSEREAIALAPTEHVEAYTHYLKGMDFRRMETRVPLLRARQLFARATELDPNYAQAYASRALCGSILRSQHGEDISLAELLADADRALAIAPNLPVAHVARANALVTCDRFDEAMAAFDRALLLDPDNAEAHLEYGRLYTMKAEFDLAIQHYLRSMEIQPEDCFSPLMLSQALQKLGRHDEARAYNVIGVKRAEEALRQHPENTRPAQLIAPSLAYLGRRQEALDLVERILAADPDDNQARYNVACTFASLGEANRAIELIEDWMKHVTHDSEMWFVNDPDFDPIKDHPRFRAIVDSLGVEPPPDGQPPSAA